MLGPALRRVHAAAGCSRPPRLPAPSSRPFHLQDTEKTEKQLLGRKRGLMKMGAGLFFPCAAEAAGVWVTYVVLVQQGLLQCGRNLEQKGRSGQSWQWRVLGVVQYCTPVSDVGKGTGVRSWLTPEYISRDARKQRRRFKTLVRKRASRC